MLIEHVIPIGCIIIVIIIWNNRTNTCTCWKWLKIIISPLYINYALILQFNPSYKGHLYKVPSCTFSPLKRGHLSDNDTSFPWSQVISFLKIPLQYACAWTYIHLQYTSRSTCTCIYMYIHVHVHTCMYKWCLFSETCTDTPSPDCYCTWPMERSPTVAGRCGDHTHWTIQSLPTTGTV